MWQFALGLFACACLSLAPAGASAANPVTPVTSSVDRGSRVFRVAFRAGESVNAGDGTYYEVVVKTSAGVGCASRAVDYEVMAPRGRRLKFVFTRGRRPWCRGRWSGSVYWVRDRSLTGECAGSACVTRTRVGRFSFRI